MATEEQGSEFCKTAGGSFQFGERDTDFEGERRVDRQTVANRETQGQR